MPEGGGGKSFCFLINVFLCVECVTCVYVIFYISGGGGKCSKRKSGAHWPPWFLSCYTRLQLLFEDHKDSVGVAPSIRFRSFASHCAESMSFFRGRGAGFRRGHREKDEINRAVSIGRHRGSTTYQFTEKQSRSLSELSSLTDVSLSDLTDVKVDLNSSLLKVNFLFELKMQTAANL